MRILGHFFVYLRPHDNMFTGLGGLRGLSLLFLLVNNRKKILQLLLSDYKTLNFCIDGIYQQGFRGIGEG